MVADAFGELLTALVPGPATAFAVVAVALAVVLRSLTPALLAWVHVFAPRRVRARALAALRVIRAGFREGGAEQP